MIEKLKPLIKIIIIFLVATFSIVLSLCWINVDPKVAMNLGLGLFCLLLAGLHTFIAIQMVEEEEFFWVFLNVSVALFQMSCFWDIIINIFILK